MRHRWPIEDQIAAAQSKRSSGGAVWYPIPNSPQEMAYHSESDELFYGGAAGGGKTDLLVGLAGFAHRKSVIFRRIFPSVRDIIERSRQVYNSEGESHAKDSYNESTHIWRLLSGRLVEFGACQHEKNKEAQRGRARDLYGFDEITEFTETQYRFITAWNRSTYRDRKTGKKQRCRVVATGNPPTSEDGEWVIRHWGPWLDEDHPMFPTAPGDLRWVARIEDTDIWFMPDAVARGEDGRAWISHEGKRYRVRSRTFIPAKLTDNPYLSDTDYDATLDALPEPLRSQMRNGMFSTNREVNPWQVIPTDWIKQAQARWKEQEAEGAMTAMGVDVSHGGRDKTVISRVYGSYFAELISYPGHQIKRGQDAAAKVVEALGDAGVIPNIDAIGYGASCADALFAMDIPANAVNVGVRTVATDRSGKFTFTNTRAWIYWLLREALDPEYGVNIALPDERELLSDLSAARYTVQNGKIHIEAKESIITRLGRSPDCGDAILLANAGELLLPVDDKPEEMVVYDERVSISRY